MGLSRQMNRNLHQSQLASDAFTRRSIGPSARNSDQAMASTGTKRDSKVDNHAKAESRCVRPRSAQYSNGAVHDQKTTRCTACPKTKNRFDQNSWILSRLRFSKMIELRRMIKAGSASCRRRSDRQSSVWCVNLGTAASFRRPLRRG